MPNFLQTSLLSTSLLPLILLSMLTACGFKLAGDVAGGEPIFVTAQKPASELRRELQQQLGAQAISAPSSTTRSIDIKHEKSDERLLALDANGQPLEYELSETATVRIADQDHTFSARRSYRFNPQTLLAHEREIAVLRAEMRREIARAILRSVQ